MSKQMTDLIRTFPSARKRPFFAEMKVWDAKAVDDYACSAGATSGDIVLASFLLEIWKGEQGPEWEWVTPRFSLRAAVFPSS